MKPIAPLAIAAVLAVEGIASAQTMPPPVYQPQPIYTSPPPKVIRDYEEGDGVPPGYHPVRRPRIGLAAAGGSILLATYLFTALGGLSAMALDKNESSHVSDAVLFLPVAGPFIRTIGNDSLASTLLVIDGVLQLGGAAMLAVGFAAQKTVLVRNDYAVMPVPIAMPNGGGAGIIGRF